MRRLTWKEKDDIMKFIVGIIIAILWVLIALILHGTDFFKNPFHVY